VGGENPKNGLTVEMLGNEGGADTKYAAGEGYVRAPA